MRIPHVLHSVVKPITTGEFAEALRSMCRQQLQSPAQLQPHPVSVACSGGVDSMALMCLFALLRREHPDFTLGGLPLGTIHALIVDHMIRHDSRAEARRVSCTLIEHFGNDGLVRPHILTLAWSQLLGPDWPPDAQLAGLPNLEQWARRGRFRALARACRQLRTMRLFLAHHEDDNYETVLLRLAMGYSGAGLQGISPVADIPECNGLYGCSRSGLHEWKAKHQEPQQSVIDHAWPDLSISTTPSDNRLQPIALEDGGITVYRPLLGFPKARLMATCEAAALPWVEDPSNQDVSLTPRNALRHLRTHFPLPTAVLKPAVLAMAQTLRVRHEAVAAEARRSLIRHGAVRNFSPHSGLLLIKFPAPVAGRKRCPWVYDHRRRRRRRLRAIYLRLVAAAMLRHAIGLVSSDPDLPPLSSLETLIPIVFATNAAPGSRQKPFTHSHVLFTPISPETCPATAISPFSRACPSGETLWQLSRQPLPAKRPGINSTIPRCLFHFRHPTDCPFNDHDNINYFANDSTKDHTNDSSNSITPFQLWDNRFWIRIHTRQPGTYAIAPPTPAHLQRLRSVLPHAEADLLARRLRILAPAKTRLTLPGLYIVRDPDEDDGLGTLVALPSLGIGVPGWNRWLRCDVRYKKVDWGILPKDGRTDDMQVCAA